MLRRGTARLRSNLGRGLPKLYEPAPQIAGGVSIPIYRSLEVCVWIVSHYKLHCVITPWVISGNSAGYLVDT